MGDALQDKQVRHDASDRSFDLGDYLRSETERQLALVQAVDDAILVVDEDGIIRAWNRGASKVFGYLEAEVYGWNVSKLLASDEVEYNGSSFLEFQKQGTPAAVGSFTETVAMRRGGEEFPIELAVNEFFVQDKREYAAVIRDITEKKELELIQEETDVALRGYTMAIEQQIAEIDNLRLEAEWAASHDALTGLLTRRAWVAAIEEQGGGPVAIMDIDHFKRVNDEHGHPAGDAVLAEVARRIATAAEPHVVCRLGGEEFGVLFSGSLQEAEDLVTGVLRAVAADNVRTGADVDLSITVSAGISDWVASAPSREDSLERTYAEADQALYRAKTSGRNRSCVAGEQLSEAA